MNTKLAMPSHDDCAIPEIIDGIIERQAKMEDEHDERRVETRRFNDKIEAHIREEDSFKREILDRFRGGDERMGNIETEIVALNKLVAAFEGFRRSFNIIAALGSAMMLMFLWILLEKNADIKAMQETLLRHSTSLERIVVSHGELERDTHREIDRIQRDLDKRK